MLFTYLLTFAADIPRCLYAACLLLPAGDVVYDVCVTGGRLAGLLLGAPFRLRHANILSFIRTA